MLLKEADVRVKVANQSREEADLNRKEARLDLEECKKKLQQSKDEFELIKIEHHKLISQYQVCIVLVSQLDTCPMSRFSIFLVNAPNAI